MTFNGWLQIALYVAIIALLTRPMGAFLTAIFTGAPTPVSALVGPLERGLYRIAGVREEQEQHWLAYALSMLAFNAAGFALLYGLQRAQGMLPLNPEGLGGVPPDLAFNTAISFVTNTNWQAYTPEAAMGYLVQMAGLTVQNFVSAATGIALAVALVRGFARRSAATIGNFWVDLTRATLHLLLPLSLLAAIVLVWQGVPQNLGPSVQATTLEGAHQLIAQGPVASQEAIKMLGTNGGGFFNANAAHPYENPTALTNLLSMTMIFAIGAGLTNMLGRMVADERQGWAILAVMAVLFLGGTALAYAQEAGGNPLLSALPVDQAASSLQPGGNMEGKEVRFGIANSALFATVTTAASCGAVNAMHDSLMPLGGLVPLANILLGEIIVGGVGAGLYGMLLFVIVAMFVAGLMVGRTPEYLGKKLEAWEVKMTMLAILILPFSILGFAAWAIAIPAGTGAMANAGPHGLSELLYAYASATGNNGSAFAGFAANEPFLNITLGLAMLAGRFAMIVPMLAVAGSLAAKRLVPVSAGTLPTHGPLFVGLVVGVILIVGGLTFLPVLVLGPVVEHLTLLAGTTY